MMSIFGFFRQPNVQSLKTQGDVEGLIEALSYEKDENVRLAAAWALGEMGDQRAIEPLINALQDQQRVKEAAAKSLGEIGDAQAVQALTTILHDDNWEVRGTVAKSLGKIGDQRAIQALIRSVEDENETVRWYAVQALHEITGELFGENKEQWQVWYSQNK